MAQYYTRRLHAFSTHSAPPHYGLKWYEIDAYSTGPFAPPLTRSLAPLTHSLARYATLICLLARSLSRSRAHGKEVYFYELNAWISCHFNP